MEKLVSMKKLVSLGFFFYFYIERNLSLQY